MNAVVWESVFQRYSVLAKTVSFLGITGTLQVEDVNDASNQSRAMYAWAAKVPESNEKSSFGGETSVALEAILSTKNGLSIVAVIGSSFSIV